MKNIFLSLLIVILGFSACQQQKPDPAQYVNPFIGLDRAAVSAAATCPWGMVSPGPYYGRKKYDTLISGFGHLRISGTGCGDIWGTVILSPAKGKNTTDRVYLESEYSQETAKAGYYSCYLNKHQILSQMTATPRTAIHRYTFDSDSQFVLVDLSQHVNHKYDSSYIKLVSAKEVEGYVSEGSFCSSSPDIGNVYFVVIFNKEAASTGVWDHSGLYEGQKEHRAKEVGAFLRYDLPKGDSLEARVGISYVSIANARLNLEKEQHNLTFEQIRANAYESWNTQLSKIEVEGNSVDDKIIFYTGIYHMLLHPSIFNDVNGDYKSKGSVWRTEGKHQILNSGNRTRYSVYSLWDTYRNLHPFLTLVYPEIQSDMLQSMVEMYKEDGWLPKWEQAGRETFNMNGAPATPVIADSYLKGIRDFDFATAYEAMIKDATYPDTSSRERNRPGLEQYIQYGGYIPQEYVRVKPPVWGPVSTTLEYNFADWTLAQMAKELGKEDDYKTFSARSLGYRNFYDPQYKLLRPKSKSGDFYKPFYPEWFTMFCDSCPYVEGNAWQYTWFVPHDVKGLIELMGGDEAFTQQLQICFDSGYYTLHNEPDMAFPYLFNYVKGEERRTQKLVRHELRKGFNTSRRGIPGEDDTGVLSAFAVFSMMGFYPDCPAKMEYQLNSPVFDKITIHLNNTYYKGNTFVIETKNNSEENIFIQSMNLNGKAHPSYSLHHNDMTKGGKLIIELTK